MTRASGRREGRREMADDPKTITHGLYNNHDGLFGRDPNVMYLDIAERVHAAESAKALGFDVDDSDAYKNYITAGTPLVTKGNLGDNLTSNPSTALLNARRDKDIVVDPVSEAEFVVAPEEASPFSASTPADSTPALAAPVATPPAYTPPSTTDTSPVA